MAGPRRGRTATTRTLHARRAVYLTAIGDASAAKLEQGRADAITPASAVDLFWQGVADRLLGEAARAKDGEKQAEVHYRRAAAAYVAVLRLRPIISGATLSGPTASTG